MKKAAVLFVLVIFVFACSHKTIITSDAKPKDNAVATTVTSNAETIAQGKVVYDYRCGRCHNLKPVDKYTAQEWSPILKIMIHKSRMNETDSLRVSTYVLANAKKA